MISRRRIGWLLAGALALGITGGVLWPSPPAPELGEHEIPWSLPPVADLQRHVPQDHATIIRDMPWNVGASSTDEAESATARWRLAGIIREQTPLILVITPEQPGRAQRVHLGEPLPDESVLEAIEHDQALVRRGECITTWHLFHPQPIATSDACQGDAEIPVQGTSP